MKHVRKSPGRVVAILVVIALASVAGHGGGRAVGAPVPETIAPFSNPEQVDHPLFPIVPGAVKVYSGREDGQRVTFVETHLTETREFEWGGGTVSCRGVRTLAFVSGALVGTRYAYFARADDGTVYQFGETETEQGDEEEEDGDAEEPSGWVVGQRAASDPEDIVTGASPALFLPAVPEPGDTWLRENLPPSFVVTSEARGRRTVRVPAGRPAGCLRVRSTNHGEGESGSSCSAPGIGLVKTNGHRERVRLQASTIR